MNIIKPPVKMGPSKTFCYLLMIIHSVAIYSTNITTLPFFLKFLFSSVCLINFFITINKYALRSMPSSIVEIVESKRKEEWILVQRDGTGHHCIIKTPFLVTRHLISLKLKSKESNLIFPMVIFSDAITQEEMRRLRYCFRNK